MVTSPKASLQSTNVGVVERMISCYNMLDADGLRPLLHGESKHSAPGSDFGADLVGADKIVAYFRQNVFPSFHRVRFEVVHLYEDSAHDVVVVEWRSHLEPKTGKTYSNTGAFVIELQRGTIYWVREYFDTEKAHAHVASP